MIKPLAVVGFLSFSRFSRVASSFRTVRLCLCFSCACLFRKMSKSNMVIAMGLVFLLVGSSLMPSAEAASCSIFQLLPCMAASKNAKVTPSRSCCANVSSMGKGLAGANCLCSLLYSSLAKSQGVNPKIAITIPRRCHLPVIKGYKCHGNQSSCAAHSDHPGTPARDQSYYLNCLLHDAWYINLSLISLELITL